MKRPRFTEGPSIAILQYQLFDGRKISILAVIDLISQFPPALDPYLSYKAPVVIQALDLADALTGYPRAIRVDKGPEVVAPRQERTAIQIGVTLDFSRLGNPTDNVFAEFFNGTVQNECLNTAWFLSLDDAHQKCKTAGAETTTKNDPKLLRR